MNIGDKVRMLHSSEQGVITKLIDAFLVEVEIEEGFNIPVKRSEVVVVASEEEKQFGKFIPSKKETPSSSAAKIKKSEPVAAQKGIYAAFVATNDQQYTLYLINNTDFILPFVLGKEQEDKYLPLFAGKLEAKSHQRVYQVNVLDITDWGVFVFQCLFFDLVKHQNLPPFLKRMRFRPNTFFKTKQKAPIIGKDAFVFQLDQGANQYATQKEDKPTVEQIDPQKLKEKMFENYEKNTTTEPKVIIKAPKIEVDLHIEEITKDYATLNSGEILEIQLRTFEQSLESAIVGGLREMIFIHGVGNGKLRTEIHRRLSGHQDIAFFKDAQKERFGYGATLVRFK